MKIEKLKNYKKTFFVVKIENDVEKEFLNEISRHTESLKIKQYDVWKNHFLIKFSKKTNEEKNFDKTYNGELKFKIITDFVQKKAKEEILEALKNMKIEPKKEQKEFDDDYYSNFRPVDAVREKDNLKTLKDLVCSIKKAAKNNEICIVERLTEDYKPALSLLSKNGFKVEYITDFIRDCMTNKINAIIRIWW